MTIDQKVRFARFAGILQGLCFLGLGVSSLMDAIGEPRALPIFLVVVSVIGFCANAFQHGPGGFYHPDSVRRRLEDA